MNSYQCKRNFSSAALDGTSFYVPFGATLSARISGRPDLVITKNCDNNETVIIQYKRRTCVTKVSKFIKYFRLAY